ncbi:MAG: DNA-processing protein DprA [Bacteroidales bacterium]|nr:DNA-processing protein DprA [Candidatus Hennigimonas equi]
MEYSEDVCTYALSRIFLREPKLSRAVIDTLGSAGALFSLDADGLFEALGPFSKYRDAIAATDLGRTAEELHRILKETSSRYMWHSHPDFPRALSGCEDAPVGFFFRSVDEPGNIFNRESVSVVGTRDITPYGKEWCGKVVAALGETVERPSVVSGLAYGVDITAQLKALETGLPTIAVLGNGTGSIYPAAHSRYAERIAGTKGCAVISEYPPDTEVLAVNFLARNRIIAGLSRATVLVESKIRGGGMTTARIAFSYGRDVFAVPGRNDDIRSQGCNALIQSRTAEALADTERFLESLGYRRRRGTAAAASVSISGSDVNTASSFLVRIRSRRGITVEELAAEEGLPVHRARAILTGLEADGIIDMDILGRCTINRS